MSKKAAGSSPAWAEPVARYATATENLGHTLTVQGAFGWMFRGRWKDARSVLETMPVSALEQVSAAATALSKLADEVAARRPR